MKTGPLNESELEWLDDILTKYNTDHAILDVAELDGLLTAVLSSPQEIEPAQWLVAVWGGADYVPRWASEKEMTRFMNLAFQHMASPHVELAVHLFADLALATSFLGVA
ncbi:UPF0149 family protein, partial [Escherichia sp. R-CC3]